MAGWFTMNAPGGTAVKPAQPGPTGLAPNEPIKVGAPAQPADPTNPNAQLAGYAGAGAMPHQDASGTWVDANGNPTNTGFAGMDTVNPATRGISPSGGATDYKGQFLSIMGGLPATPANLAAKEQELQRAGFRVVRSGDGTAGKIAIPGGQVVDVIQGAHAGGGGSWQWMGGDSGGVGSLGNFQTGTFTGGGKYPLASVIGEGLAQPWTTPFNAPDPNSVTGDKALQWQMGRGRDVIERSAAAKGTLLTGGLLKSLDTFGQGLASTYYGDVYNRALGEYGLSHSIYEQNNSNLYNRLFGVSNMGAQAAGAMGNYGTNYANGATNLQTGMANSRSAGTIDVGNAIGNAVGGVINAAGQLGTGGSNSQSSYNPNAIGPSYGDPNMVQGSGAPWNTYQQPFGGGGA